MVLLYSQIFEFNLIEIISVLHVSEWNRITNGKDKGTIIENMRKPIFDVICNTRIIERTFHDRSIRLDNLINLIGSIDLSATVASMSNAIELLQLLFAAYGSVGYRFKKRKIDQNEVLESCVSNESIVKTTWLFVIMVIGWLSRLGNEGDDCEPDYDCDADYEADNVARTFPDEECDRDVIGNTLTVQSIILQRWVSDEINLIAFDWLIVW